MVVAGESLGLGCKGVEVLPADRLPLSLLPWQFLRLLSPDPPLHLLSDVNQSRDQYQKYRARLATAVAPATISPALIAL